MIVSDTLYARHSETSATAFVLAPSNVSLTIRKPDGSAGSHDVIIVSPGTSALVQNIATLFSAPIGGEYDLLWSIVVDTATIERAETYFACWTDIYTQVRSLLRSSITDIADYDIDITLVQILASLPQLVDSDIRFDAYQQVPQIDRTIFDRALALMVAAWMRPFAPRRSTSGAITSFTSGTEKYTWQADLRKSYTLTIEEQWIDAAWGLLRATSMLNTSMHNWSDVNVGFRASGRRRTKQSPYLIDSSGQPYSNPAFALWQGWLDLGGVMPWSWSGA